MDPPRAEPTSAPATTQSVPTTAPSSNALLRGPALRPQSASHVTRKVLLRRPDHGCERTENSSATASSSSTTLVPTKPRPPSASAAICSTTTRRIRPHASTATTTPRPNVLPSNQNGSSGAEVISPLIMREEIETQRKVTRRAQRELNALRLQHTQRAQEMELLTRHLQAFEVESYANPHSPQRISSSSGVSSGGTTNVSKRTRVDAFKEEIRRLDAYKKTLRQLQERLARHLQFLTANAELLESKRVAAARELALFQDKTAQERSLCTELEFKLTLLVEEREVQAQHAQQLLHSLRTEIQSRALVHQQRSEADRRREEMLRLVESRPNATPPDQPEKIHRSASNKALMPAQKRASHGRRDSLRLLVQESLQFFGAGDELVPSSQTSLSGSTTDSLTCSPAVLGVSMSSRRLQTLRQHPSTAGSAIASFGESLAAAMQRETFYQVYEAQYERILEQTGESDLAIVLDRFMTYEESMKRLQQIEIDLDKEHATLEATRISHNDHLQQLRLSGIAEVEKRKKIRDFLEQQYHVKSQQRTEANEAFVEHLKTFSYVQQGILNITELLKCLDEKFNPPALAQAAAASTLGVVSSTSMVHHSVTTAAAIAEIDWLQSLLHSCRTVARSNPSLPVVFSLEQIAKLAQIDPVLGFATSSFAWQEPSDMETQASGDNQLDDSEQRRKPVEKVESEDSDQDSDDESDSDSDVDDRERVKTKERETLEQVELLFRTLDSRLHLARQEQSMHRLRRAFGLGTLGEEEAEEVSEKPTQPDPAAKLAAVHAFFKEKRLREKNDSKRQAAAVGGGHGVSLRGQLIGNGGGGAASSGGSHNGGKSVAAIALTAFTAAAKPTLLRKRSNAVSFAPMGALQGQPQAKPTAIAAEEATRRPTATMSTANIKQPTRPPTASAAPTHRRASNTPAGQRSGPDPQSKTGSGPNQLVVRRPQSSHVKKR